jgi:Leucine-rich repeat (LRR) protein
MRFTDDNQLMALPPKIGNLTNLIQLHLRNNQLTALPLEIRNLTNLIQLSLSDNQLTSPPPEIVKQGAQEILAYLREQL